MYDFRKDCVVENREHNRHKKMRKDKGNFKL